MNNNPTYDEALEFFSRFGNVSFNVIELGKVKPTAAQLQAACEHAVRVHKKPGKEVLIMRMVVLAEWMTAKPGKPLR
jgi:hypothetical protein